MSIYDMISFDREQKQLEEALEWDEFEQWKREKSRREAQEEREKEQLDPSSGCPPW